MTAVKEISEIIEGAVPYYAKRVEVKKAGLISSVPEAEHKIVYDSMSDTLEPLYFWTLELMQDFGLDVEKLIDNFSSAPGSGHFSELGGKSSAMQQQGSKLLADIGILTRSILQIIYDLKEFRIRLSTYDDLNSENSQGAKQSLKQIWLDKVDIQKGNGAIHAMTQGQLGFATLRDAFLIVNTEKEINDLDLNDRVKRILYSRLEQFNSWLTASEQELRKRYEIEKNYLRSQVNSLKMYSRWAKPYLKAAFDLEQKDQGRNPNFVKTFNTIILELTLLGKSKIDVKKAALSGDLPKDFQKLKTKRDYYEVVLVDFRFRGIPQKIAQRGDYAFGGKTEITFKGYAMNEDELAKLEQELESSDVGDALRLIEGATDDSLKEMQREIEEFLEEPEKKSNKKNKGIKGENPILAIFGVYNKEPEKKPENPFPEKKNKIDRIRPDDWIEKTHLRELAADGAKQKAFQFFDIYKKAHGMASYT